MQSKNVRIVSILVLVFFIFSCSSTFAAKPPVKPKKVPKTTIQKTVPTKKPPAQHKSKLTTKRIVSTERKLLDSKEIYKQSSPAVVYIDVTTKTGRVTGSGFIISSDGYIATCEHVVKNAVYTTITLPSNQQFLLTKPVVRDWVYDLAIFKLNNVSNLPYIKLGDSNCITTGEKVAAIGNPKGLENSISEGIISQTQRVIEDQTLIQITAPISAGSSGGVLLNMYNEAIGVTSGVVEGRQNLNFAIPINVLNKMYNKLIKSTSNAFASTSRVNISAPQNVKTIAVSEDKIFVYWDSVIGADSYNVYFQSNNSKEPYQIVGSTVKNALLCHSLKSDQTYNLKVNTVKNSLESADSKVITTTTLKDHRTKTSYNDPEITGESFIVCEKDGNGDYTIYEITLTEVDATENAKHTVAASDPQSMFKSSDYFCIAYFQIKNIYPINKTTEASNLDWSVAVDRNVIVNPNPIIINPKMPKNSVAVQLKQGLTNMLVLNYGTSDEVWFDLSNKRSGVTVNTKTSFVKSNEEQTRTDKKQMSSQDIYERYSPAVVLIKAKRNDSDLFGSGFIANASGDVITSLSLVEGANTICVTTLDKKSFFVNKPISVDKKNDIAIFRLKSAKNMPFVEFGNSNLVFNGQKVLLIGNILTTDKQDGYELSITSGIVSQTNREIDGQRLIQNTTPLSPGSAGGPLFNSFGEAIGIAIFTMVDGQNLNFAIPINFVTALLKSTPARDPLLKVDATGIPPAPRNVEAIPVNMARIHIQWDPVLGVDSYEVYTRNVTLNSSFTLIGTTSKSEFDTTGLSCQQAYEFKIVAVKKDKKSKESETAMAKQFE
ncbi:MAG: trypsin-like peptidase domain-containing protein [Acidobacteriota bacterium]